MNSFNEYGFLGKYILQFSVLFCRFKNYKGHVSMLAKLSNYIYLSKRIFSHPKLSNSTSYVIFLIPVSFCGLDLYCIVKKVGELAR